MQITDISVTLAKLALIAHKKTLIIAQLARLIYAQNATIKLTFLSLESLPAL